VSQVPVAIAPADRPAVPGKHRSLGPCGIPVHGIDTDPLAFEFASRYITLHRLPNADDTEESRLQFLLDLDKQYGQAMLYPITGR
jgi:hypothetical protein